MERYKVGERVLWVPLFNSPDHYMPGEKVPGEIINVFSDPPIYRIMLDRSWDNTISDKSLRGEQIIVGNIMHHHIFPIAKPSLPE